MRIQLRAQCSVCNRDQAVNGDEIVDHGFTLDWGSRNGRCLGSRRPHFGTKDGRDLRAELAGRLAERSVEMIKMVNRVESGLTVPNLYDRANKRIENPMPWQINQWVAARRHDAGSLQRSAHALTCTVDEWKERFPREVQVEIKVTLLHLSSKRWNGGKLCAGSYMGSRKGVSITNEAQVTCPKCRALMDKGRS